MVWRVLVFVAALAILILVATEWNHFEGRAGWQSTDDAYLQADLTPILSRVSGYVAALLGQDFQRVRGGDLFAQIADADYRATAAQVGANVAAAKARAEALKAQLALQQANVARSVRARPADDRGRQGRRKGHAAVRRSATAQASLSAAQMCDARTGSWPPPRPASAGRSPTSIHTSPWADSTASRPLR